MPPVGPLTVKNLNAGFGRRRILHDLSPKPFVSGQICALTGPNGSGKSTFLRALSGLIPSQATLTLGDENLAHLPLAQRAQRCLYLPQTLPAAVQLPVIEALMAAQRACGPRRHEEITISETEHALAWLDRLSVSHLALKNMSTLSGGQRQLIGLAQALSRRPVSLLLDEPLSALDLHHQFAVMRLLQQETRERPLITLIVLHDLNIALNMADRVLLLHEGRIKADGLPAEVLTPEVLRDVYRVHAHVERGQSGRPFIQISGIAEKT
ncbi:ABC transporter ATP-binding protein [Acetobacter thailandicus]|uniref:ABC transporter ATP-binding protein n=1 Tax=Acetobacter thailandicus TaxID=1502842 RepID=A0ABT3QEN2_9PROT|nr:ABC transporter ATP-binding protein [Acetobacter thailandicus]MCX2563748.1 ABC transporter ATP-binding protein [Acetobacter thailandicus]NHN95177.1 ATP-binding cassette domain-containing protein [Acetobacter thailandicus]